MLNSQYWYSNTIEIKIIGNTKKKVSGPCSIKGLGLERESSWAFWKGYAAPPYATSRVLHGELSPLVAGMLNPEESGRKTVSPMPKGIFIPAQTSGSLDSKRCRIGKIHILCLIPLNAQASHPIMESREILKYVSVLKFKVITSCHNTCWPPVGTHGFLAVCFTGYPFSVDSCDSHRLRGDFKSLRCFVSL